MVASAGVAEAPGSVAAVGAAFHPGDLQANLAGSLTDRQRRVYAGVDRDWRKGTLGLAAVFAAIGVILLTATGPAPNAAYRPLAAAAFLALAVGTVLWSLPSRDPLARDLRTGRVEVMEGAIGKHRVSGTGSARNSTHYLDVGDRHFEVPMSEYEAAPDAGWVRLCYLPRSHRVVNLERLPDKPLPAGAMDAPMDAVKDVLRDLKSSRGGARLEVMAEMQAMENVMQPQRAAQAAPPSGPRLDPGSLAQAIVGSWRSGVLSVTFLPDGTAHGGMPGMEQTGRWSIDAAGHLHAQLMGRDQSGEAWISGDTLTISVGGEGLAFRRVQS